MEIQLRATDFLGRFTGAEMRRGGIAFGKSSPITRDFLGAISSGTPHSERPSRSFLDSPSSSCRRICHDIRSSEFFQRPAESPGNILPATHHKNICPKPQARVARFSTTTTMAGWIFIWSTAAHAISSIPTRRFATRFIDNNRDGTFTDVTEKAGVQADGYGMGVAVGDYDGDGFPDLYVTQYGGSILYHNNGDGTFTDVTEKAGVAAPGWSSSAVWFDYDNDGRLDLFVCRFVDFDKDKNFLVRHGDSPSTAFPASINRCQLALP